MKSEAVIFQADTEQIVHGGNATFLGIWDPTRLLYRLYRLKRMNRIYRISRVFRLR